MKKVAALLLSLFLLVITGCEKKIDKFYLEDKYYGTKELEDVPADTIKNLENDEESFAVFVYMASCTSCAHFDTVLEEFLEENPMKFYKVSLLNIDETKMAEDVRYSPSVVLYNKGEVVAYLNAVSDDDMMYYESAENFKEWFTKYVYLKDNN